MRVRRDRARRSTRGCWRARSAPRGKKTPSSMLTRALASGHRVWIASTSCFPARAGARHRPNP